MQVPGYLSCYNAPQKPMASVPIPQLPIYRVTLFYGPESATDDSACLTCVFNVKKRSWKGGVQIAVDVDDRQMASLRDGIGFESWLAGLLRPLDENERAANERRATDLFAQEVCSIKLSLALEAELRQENSRIESHRFIEELDRAVLGQADRMKSIIQGELDLAVP